MYIYFIRLLILPPYLRLMFPPVFFSTFQVFPQMISLVSPFPSLPFFPPLFRFFFCLCIALAPTLRLLTELNQILTQPFQTIQSSIKWKTLILNKHKHVILNRGKKIILTFVFLYNFRKMEILILTDVFTYIRFHLTKYNI